MDCNITENYFKEKARMSNYCNIKCEDCPISHPCASCSDLEIENPKQCIDIVQKWSDEHPNKTYRDDFREKFPNCELLVENLSWCDFYRNGISIDNCLNCEDCWNQPFPETFPAPTKDKKKTRIITNRDKLQSLTNNELAEILTKDKPCSFCGLKNTECDYDEICSVRIKEWLESEVE